MHTRHLLEQQQLQGNLLKRQLAFRLALFALLQLLQIDSLDSSDGRRKESLGIRRTVVRQGISLTVVNAETLWRRQPLADSLREDLIRTK